MNWRAPILLIFPILMGGCATHRRGLTAFRLAGPILTPPGPVAKVADIRTFVADAVPGAGSCTPAPGIELAVRKKRLSVTLRREKLIGLPDGYLSEWAAEMEARGCIAPHEATGLADQIAYALPLNLNAAFHLLHANSIQTGWVDIGPHSRIQVVSRIIRGVMPSDGPISGKMDVTGNDRRLIVTGKMADELIGVETAWYGMLPKGKRAGLTIAPLFAERRIDGRTERRAAPETDYFHFPPDAGFYRLFYKAGQTEYTALVIAAGTGAELEKRSRQVETAANACGDMCVAIPKSVGVNSFLSVQVNGAEVLVSLGATVGNAIHQSGVNRAEEVLPHLAIEKLFRGRPVPVDFDRANPSILGMTLTGGEVIAFSR